VSDASGAPLDPSAPLDQGGPLDPSAPLDPIAQLERRPWLERIGLAGVAFVFATLFALVAAGSWAGGDAFLAAMAGIGSLMTVWVGLITLLRG